MGGKGGKAWSPKGFWERCYSCGGTGHSSRWCLKGKGGKGKGGKPAYSFEGGTGKEVTLGGEAAQVAPGVTGGAAATQFKQTPEPEAEAVNENIKMMVYVGYAGPGRRNQWNPWADQWGCYTLEEALANTLEEVPARVRAQASINTVTPELPKLKSRELN